MDSNLFRSGKLAYNSTAERDNRFRAVFLRILGYAEARPHPRWQWNDIAQGKRRPWAMLQDSARSLAFDAVNSGDQLRIEMTRQSLITLYDDLRADCLALFPADDIPSLPTAVMEETIAQCRLDPHEIELVRSPTKANAEKALPFVQDNWIKLGRLKAVLMQTIHNGETRSWA